MTQIRKKHSPAFNAKVAVAALKGEQTIAQLASQFQVHPSQVNTWRKALLEGAENVFEDGHSRDKDNEALVSRLYQQIGQLTVERDFLQKRCGA